MLYTGKGDSGTTKTFGCNQRISKSSSITEALGTLDEINSFLGLVKAKSIGISFVVHDREIELAKTIDRIQQDLFIAQAELAGAPKSITQEKVTWLEEITDGIEKTLPPVKTFFVPGGTELSALFDIARAIARRAERRVVAVVDERKIKISEPTCAYLNRLSSILYAFVRMSNKLEKVDEKIPTYK